MRRLSMLILVVALATAACKIESNLEAELNADGTGTVTFEAGVDDEALELLGADDPLGEVPEGAATTVVEEGDLTYYKATVPFSDAAELTQLVAEGEQAAFTTFSASFSATRVTVDGTVGDTGGFGGEDLEGLDPALIEENMSAQIRIVMPGRVIESNADSTDGSTLTWDVPLLGGGLTVHAVSDPTQAPAGGGLPAWTIVLITAGALAAIGILALLGIRRRRTPETAVTADR